MSRRKAIPQPMPVSTPAAIARDWRFDALAFAGLALLVLVVFGQTLGFALLSWDDNYHITRNPRLNPPSATSLAEFWTAPQLGLYAPLSYSFFALEAALASRDATTGLLRPTVFHAGNLLLHVVCCWFAYLLVARLTKHAPAALAAACLFAVHPLQVESVAWVSETRGLLASLFSLAALWLFVRDSQRPASWPATTGILACLSLALLAKPSAAALPLAIAVLGLYLKVERKRLLVVVVPAALLAVAFALGTKLLQGDELMREVPPPWLRPFVALDALSFYALKTIRPTGLGPDYGWRISWLVAQWWFYLAWTLPFVAFILLWRYDRSRERLAQAAFSVALFAPVLGFIPFGFQEISTVADRYAYLPLLAVAWGIAAWLTPRWNFGWGMTAGAGAVLCAFLSFQQTGAWRDDDRLFTRMASVNPQSFVACMNMGIGAVRAGQINEGLELARAATELGPNYPLAWYNLGSTQLQLGNWPEAVSALARANTLQPRKLETLNNLGRGLIEMKQLAPAVRVLTEAIEVDAQSREAHSNLGDAYLRQREFAQAERHIATANRLDPEFRDAWILLASVRRQQGRIDDAREMLHSVIERWPDYASAEYALGEIAAIQEDWPAAERHFARAAQLNPNLPQARYQAGAAQFEQGLVNEPVDCFETLIAEYPRYVDPFHGLARIVLRSSDYARAVGLYEHALRVDPNWLMGHQQLAWIYATADSAKFRDPEKALAEFELVSKKVADPGAELLDLQAAVQAANGQLDEAVVTAQRAIELAQAGGRFLLAKRFQARRELYLAGEPYRETNSTSRIARSAESASTK